jgi:hypothetical protein
MGYAQGTMAQISQNLSCGSVQDPDGMILRADRSLIFELAEHAVHMRRTQSERIEDDFLREGQIE